MILAVAMAALAGVLIGLSRQLNGRLALSRGALGASAWNHAVGFAALLTLGALLWAVTREAPIRPSLAQAPPWAWAGGPLGVLFVAAGSWLIARIGSANTALLVIAGQMVSGALIDLLRGAGHLGPRALGVAVILAGVVLARGARGAAPPPPPAPSSAPPAPPA